jgi:hypothetical protein
MKFALIIWFGVTSNYVEHEVLNDLPTCLERKSRLEYYLNKVQSKLKVDCVQKYCPCSSKAEQSIDNR